MISTPSSNPFALLLNPEDVFRALERSDRLGRLQSRVCRPLDKPLIPRVDGEIDAFESDVDDLLDTEE